MNRSNSIFFLFIFILSATATRAVYLYLNPYGAEPDWSIRAPEFESILQAYFEFIGLSNVANRPYNCPPVEFRPLQLSHFWKPCIEIIELVGRLIIISIMQITLLSITYAGVRLRVFDKRKTEAIWLTTLFPSYIYFTNLFSPESIFITISLFTIIFSTSYWVLSFLPILFLIDVGNSMVITLFLIWFNCIRFSLDFLNKYIFWILLFLITFLLPPMLRFLLFDLEILFLLGGKGASILEAYRDGSLVQKYPSYLRWIISYMGLNYYTEGNVKVVIIYLINGLILFYFTLKNFMHGNKKGYLPLLSVLTFLPFFTSVFVGYAFAKYYVFLLPFIFLSIRYYISFSLMVVFIVFINFLVITHLLIFNAF